MIKKTRLIILLSCAVCFFIIAPVLVAYSMGYRFDFEENKIVETGGIYVRTFPTAEQITVDSKTSVKPGIFSNAIFVQSLLPKEHTVYVEKNGYYNYFKTLPVKEKEVTKLENVTLFKKSLTFGSIYKTDYFFMAPNNQNIITGLNNVNSIVINYSNLNNKNSSQKITIGQKGEILEINWFEDSSKALIKIQNAGNIFYYLFENSTRIPTATRLAYLDKNSKQISFNPKDLEEIFYEENNILYSLKNNKPATVIKNLVTYQVSENTITWVSTDGSLFTSDTSGKLINKLTEKNIAINLNKNYEILNISGKMFLKDGTSLFLFNSDTNALENFDGPQGDYKILTSPDNKNIIFQNSNDIYVYSLLDKKYEKIFSGEKITNCQWLNNDYIILTSGNNIIISEIDYRGNINTVTIPSTLNVDENKTTEIKNPKTFFISQTGILYVLTEGTLLESEKITP